MPAQTDRTIALAVFRSLASVVVVVLCTLSARAADLIWGANGHPFSAYPGVSLQTQLDLVKDLGMKSYRVNVSSIDSIRGLSDLAVLARERGITVLPVLTPGFELQKETPDALYAKAFNFSVTMVSALKGYITTWELGNEMEVFAILKPCEPQDDGKQYPCHFGPASGVTALEYHGGRWQKVSAVLKGMSDGVISVDPKLKKAIGTAGWGHTGAFERMEKDGIRWDISVWHAYQIDPEWILERVAQFKRPIWITEFNHPYGSKNGLAAQADGVKAMMQRYRQWRSRFNIEAAFFYELLDEPYWAPDFEAVMGMVTMVKADQGNGWSVSEKKPVFDVVKRSIAQSSGSITPDCELERNSGQTTEPQHIVRYGHCLILGRNPDERTSSQWSKDLSEGVPVRTFLLSLIDSDEFTTHFMRPSISNRDFIVATFEMFLRRKPDGGGLQSYLKDLSGGGMRRREMLDGIVGSGEFKAAHPVLFMPVKSASGTTDSGSPAR